MKNARKTIVDNDHFMDLGMLLYTSCGVMLDQHPCIRLSTNLNANIITIPHVIKVKVVLCAQALHVGVK
jgi:hypothetical protein